MTVVLGVGVAAKVVAGDRDEQVAGWWRVRVAQQRPDVVVHPLLLGADDRDDLGVNEDGVRRVVDLGLLKAQLRDDCFRARVVLGVWDAGDRQQAVEVQQQQLACPSAGAGEQHEDPHRLLIAEPALLGWGAEQAGVAHDLRHRVIVEVNVLVRQTWRKRLLARAPQPGMLVSECLPAWFAQRACCRFLVIGHERVEPLDVIDRVADGPVGDQLAAIRAAARAALLDVREEFQRQQPQLGAVRAQARLVDPALGDELAEDRQRVDRLSTDAQRNSPVSSAVFSCHLSASRSHRCSTTVKS